MHSPLALILNNMKYGSASGASVSASTATATAPTAVSQASAASALRLPITLSAAASAAALINTAPSRAAAAGLDTKSAAGASSSDYRFYDAHDLIEEDPTLTTSQAMIAGACAGVSEHIFMFPIDTLKTRMQEAPTRPGHPQYKNLWQTFQTVRASEGAGRLYRGLSAVVLGAIPSHAVHFATYETAKQSLGLNDEFRDGHHPFRAAICGGAAALAHDAVVTPADVIKQRLQMWNSSYSGVFDAVRRIVRNEGFRALYASYPTTVIMNVPNQAVHVATYESLKRFFSGGKTEHASSPLVQWCAGGGAGAIAGAVSTPLDVIKTRIQLYDPASNGNRPVQPTALVRHIWQNEGWRAFTKGMSARVVYNIPSAAICWTTYETVKKVLKREY